jgi:uncharacterized membrane protein YeaQ/YmgE (transglycosylase-associated protein family)
MGIISWIVLGLLIGWIASKVANKTGSGMMMDIALGVVGAVVSGCLASFRATGDNVSSILIAAIGAVVALLVYDVVEASLRKVDTGFVRSVSKDNRGSSSDDVLDPRSDIDTIAHQTAIGLFDHIAEMNANAKFDANAGSRSPNPDSQTMLKRRWPDSVKANR